MIAPALRRRRGVLEPVRKPLQFSNGLTHKVMFMVYDTFRLFNTEMVKVNEEPFDRGDWMVKWATGESSV